MLKFKNEKTVEVQDWDNLVQRTYKRPYNFQQQDGCQSRGVFRLEIPSKVWQTEFKPIPETTETNIMGVSLEDWLKRDVNYNPKNMSNWELELFWERNFYPPIEEVANDLLKRGLVEEGIYLINIDW